jgi:hypothetical protein
MRRRELPLPRGCRETACHEPFTVAAVISIRRPLTSEWRKCYVEESSRTSQEGIGTSYASCPPSRWSEPRPSKQDGKIDGGARLLVAISTEYDVLNLSIDQNIFAELRRSSSNTCFRRCSRSLGRFRLAS